MQKNQDVAAVQDIDEVVARQKVSEVSTHTSRRRPAQVPVIDLITTIMNNQKTWQPSTLPFGVTIADQTQSGIVFYVMIITGFAGGVTMGWGCARKCWRVAPEEIWMKAMRIDTETQTSELGLIQDAPMRTLARSRLPQRCQRCFEHIPIGSGVRQFTERWCHMWCDKQRVEGQHLE